MEKVGLDEGKATAVVSFFKDNAAKIPEWFGDLGGLDGIKDKVTDAIGIGGDENLFEGIRSQIDEAKDED